MDLRVGNEGNVNIFLPRPDGKAGLVRITLDPSKTKVISAGLIKLRDLASAIKSGDFIPLK